MFNQGQIYKRTEIHSRMGGQSQGGISTPINSPLILLFSGEQGKQYGYNDGWNNGSFFYTGEGQEGDMSFVRGNKAIIEHSKEGKDLHLFQYTKEPGKVIYIGQMVCTGFQEKIAPDIKGNDRKVYVFELQPLSKFIMVDMEEELNDDEIWQTPLIENRKRAFEAAEENPQVVTRNQSIIKRSEIIRIYVIQRANEHCEFCEKEAPFRTVKGRAYLESHHIRRLTDGGPDNPIYMAALCPNCHRKAHFSKERDQIKHALLLLIQEKERIT
jgi:5-methylcytosine-specific restriction enzyme A